MPIPSNMSVGQSDDLENDAAVLFTCVRAAVLTLEEDGNGTIAFGLQNACFKFQESLKAVWSEGQKTPDPSGRVLTPKAPASEAVEAQGAAFLARMEAKARDARQGCADGGNGHYDPCQCPANRRAA